MALRVLFDSLGFWERCGGVSRALSEVARREPGVEIAAAETENDYLLARGVPRARWSLRSFWPWWRWRGRGVLWRFVRPFGGADIVEKNARLLNTRLAAGDFDILHLTGAHDYGTAWRKVVGVKPIVVTVHDLIPELVRGDARIRTARAEVLSAATLVICVSESTKRDVMREYGVPESKLRVVHHGAPEGGQTPQLGGQSPQVGGQTPQLGGQSPQLGGQTPQVGGQTPQVGGQSPEPGYVLYVGKREGYKNWAWMVRELAPLLIARKWRLVCTGADFCRCERRLLAEVGLSGWAEARHVEDAELRSLYRGAVAFVYPSRYEGFGLPLLEAMAEGCPVVASDIAPFREVAGEAADYFSIDDGEGLRRALLQARRDGRGPARAASFSWDRTAAETAAVHAEAVRLWNARRIAVLMTCHNRVETTRRALASLAVQKLPEGVSLKVFLVDDGSTDGTGEMARQAGCEVVRADGSLFWSRGMRRAWETAGGGWAGYVWLNDDVTLVPEAVAKLLARGGDATVVSATVGDYALRRDGKGRPVFMPGNFVWVPRAAYAKVGMISGAYSHGAGDWDYAVRCIRAGVRVEGTEESLGTCPEEPQKRPSREARWRFLWHPKGAALKDAVRFSYVRGGWPRAVASAIHIVWRVFWRKG